MFRILHLQWFISSFTLIITRHDLYTFVAFHYLLCTLLNSFYCFLKPTRELGQALLVDTVACSASMMSEEPICQDIETEILDAQ